MKITKCEPFYTGGGIYLYYGICGFYYFIADTDEDGVTIVDSSPWETEEPYDTPLYDEWLTEHFVKNLDGKESLAFCEKMLKWVLANKPDGNYNLSDMENELDILRQRKEL